jgi:hypothetical protein
MRCRRWTMQRRLALSGAVGGLGEGRQGQSRYSMDSFGQDSHLRMRDPATGRGAWRKDDRSTHSLTVDLPKTT